MLYLVTGKTGSGKTYFLVSKILQFLQDEKDSRPIFTNIKLSLEHPRYRYLTELQVREFGLYLRETFAVVENLEQKKKEVQSSVWGNALFILDEAHLLGFQKKEEHLVNWLSLHRHFYQDIYLATQRLSNFHRDYLSFFHFHFDLVPSNRRILKDMMAYRLFDGVGGEKIETKYFRPEPEIFELYSSAKIEAQQSPIVRKAVFYFFVFVFLVLFVVYFFYSHFFLSFQKGKRYNKEKNITKTYIIGKKKVIPKEKQDIAKMDVCIAYSLEKPTIPYFAGRYIFSVLQKKKDFYIYTYACPPEDARARSARKAQKHRYE